MSHLGRLLAYLRPYRARVALAVGLIVLVTLSTLPMPRITQYLIDVALPRRDSAALARLFWIVVALYAARGIVSFSLNYTIGWLGQRIVFDLRYQCYRHLNRLSLSYYDKRQTGGGCIGK